jgi:hypothetical protein
MRDADRRYQVAPRPVKARRMVRSRDTAMEIFNGRDETQGSNDYLNGGASIQAVNRRFIAT